MPNPRINAAKMKAEALRKAKANKKKSKKGAPKPSSNLKTGEVEKPAAAVKNEKVYKKIKSTSTYNPTFQKPRFEDLKFQEKDSSNKMKGSPHYMSNELKYGGPVIDQMQTLSQASASKVLRHMKK